MRLLAPAKINLSFRIRHRRDDGFHEIETLMAPISLHDEIEITRGVSGNEVIFTCDDPSLPTGDDNLVVKAARLFLAAAGVQGGVNVGLKKRIPHGAGLGGGSSDAASTLLGLNQIFATDFDVTQLTQMAAQLGSDVPFFIHRSAAICRGRGELVEPTALPQQLPLLLIKPPFGVPTPWAYSRWREAKEMTGICYEAQEHNGTTFVNDLERPVFEKYAFLAQMKMWLLKQPEVRAAMLSGSGSTVLAVLHESAAADVLSARAKAELDPELWTCACDTIAGEDY